VAPERRQRAHQRFDPFSEQGLLTVPYIQELRERPPVSQWSEFTIIAQDPSVMLGPRILTATVRIPAEELLPGPRGARFHVVDYDAARGVLTPQAEISPNDRFARAANATLTSSPRFRAQNVYVIAARTLAAFEQALGRRLGWAFQAHQLYLVPRAFPELNAYYSPEDGAILFGYMPTAGGELRTCLSHDVIAHESTHAVLDGLRPRFAEPGLPDQPAFHEGLADVVALLSVFSTQEVVERLLGPCDRNGRIDDRRLSSGALRQTALFGLAEQLSASAGSERGSGIRRSIELKPSGEWRGRPEFVEPHRRGEVIVASVMATLLRMWTQRLKPLRVAPRIDRARVAEEGAKAATHLLGMVLRGIDYMPPVELEFEDVIDSVLKADEVVAPDDEKHGYRDALRESFEAFDIRRPPEGIIDLTQREGPAYERMNFAALRSDADEVFRFVWENAEVFEISRDCRLHVESVKPSVRVGPDGLMVAEVVAAYVQSLELSAAELGDRGVTLPRGLRPDAQLQIWGGGVLVFDQFGRAKYHQTKPLADWARQERRLGYLVHQGLADTRGRYGFTLSTPKGQRFADLHMSNERAGEDW
jgi:hypothetical protein